MAAVEHSAPGYIGGEKAFTPKVPKTLENTKLNEILVEDLICKMLLGKGVMSGRELANDLHLPFSIVEPILNEMKNRLYLAHRTTTGVGDFTYALSEQGQQKAIMAMEFSAYVGPAPVIFEEYLASVAAQSIRKEHPGEAEVKEAFSDLLLDDKLFDTIGPAINSGRGLFLYGAPGNGKTSIAERIANCFHEGVYIPRTLLIDGQIIKLFDPEAHREIIEDPPPLIAKYDARWAFIKRPVIVVGGELTMEALEIKFNELLKVSEAPLQLKANTGVFLIDDFGRQRVNPDELLNRWIVPLEKRVDYLTLPNGKKIEVPFDELILFSTNLDPGALVDDAFLRRIPYKIHVRDPHEDEFKKLFSFIAPRYNIAYDEKMVDYLINKHYRGKRPFRACQARDILEQIVNSCTYKRTAPVMTEELLDAACRNYFAAMGNQPDPEQEV